MVCRNCGCSNEDGAMFCRSCGGAMEASETPVASTETFDSEVVVSNGNAGKGLAIASLICGIVSFVLCCLYLLGCVGCITALVSIAGIVLGFIAKSKGVEGPMATIGIILNIVAILIPVVGYLIYFILAAVGAGAGMLSSGMMMY